MTKKTKTKPAKKPTYPRRTYSKIEPKEFVDQYVKNKRNGRQTIKDLNPDISEHSADVQATRMLNKAEVQLLLQTIDNHIKLNAVKAIKKIDKLIDSNNEQVAYTASKDSLDRAGFTPVKKQQTVTINIEQYIDELR